MLRSFVSSQTIRQALKPWSGVQLRTLHSSFIGYKKKGRLSISDYDDLEYTVEHPPQVTTALTEVDPLSELAHLDISKEEEGNPTDGLSISQRERQESLPASTKKLNRLLGSQKVAKFELKESDLREKFVRGSGNGGQAINKLSTCCDLMHIPTGLRVQAQPTRSLQTNREIARKLMAEKLATMDKESNLPSRAEVLTAKRRLKKMRATRRSKKKYGSDDDDEEGVQGLIEGS